MHAQTRRALCPQMILLACVSFQMTLRSLGDLIKRVDIRHMPIGNVSTTNKTSGRMDMEKDVCVEGEGGGGGKQPFAKTGSSPKEETNSKVPRLRASWGWARKQPMSRSLSGGEDAPWLPPGETVYQPTTKLARGSSLLALHSGLCIPFLILYTTTILLSVTLSVYVIFIGITSESPNLSIANTPWSGISQLLRLIQSTPIIKTEPSKEGLMVMDEPEPTEAEIRSRPITGCRGGRRLPLGEIDGLMVSQFYLELCNLRHQTKISNSSMDATSLIYDTLALLKVVDGDEFEYVHTWNDSAWQTLVRRLRDCLPPTQASACRLTYHTRTPGARGDIDFCPVSALPTIDVSLCLDYSYKLLSLRIGGISLLNQFEAMVFKQTIEDWVPDALALSHFTITNLTKH